MSSIPLCESCPHATPEGFMATILPTTTARKKFAKILKESGNPEAQKRVFFMGLVMYIFGQDASTLSATTVHDIHQCLESIWNLGNRGLNCQMHHMRHAYEQAGR
ncbi:hypothetical protein H6768_00415 [Candidatus Peribacteria bacterium]|nr:hypothetical protein [Candidatus Peribacteria bacterium]